MILESCDVVVSPLMSVRQMATAIGFARFDVPHRREYEVPAVVSGGHRKVRFSMVQFPAKTAILTARYITTSVEGLGLPGLLEFIGYVEKKRKIIAQGFRLVSPQPEWVEGDGWRHFLAGPDSKARGKISLFLLPEAEVIARPFALAGIVL